MKDITLISCSYNTPHVTSNMLKSFINFHPECEILICENNPYFISFNDVHLERLGL